MLFFTLLLSSTSAAMSDAVSTPAVAESTPAPAAAAAVVESAPAAAASSSEAPAAAAAASAEDEEKVEGADSTAEYQAVVALKPVEVATGEEQDEVLYKQSGTHTRAQLSALARPFARCVVRVPHNHASLLFVLICRRAACYRFDADSTSWKERGPRTRERERERKPEATREEQTHRRKERARRDFSWSGGCLCGASMRTRLSLIRAPPHRSLFVPSVPSH